MSVSASCAPGPLQFGRDGDFASAHAPGRVKDCETCGGSGLIYKKVEREGRKYEVSEPCARQVLEDRAVRFNRVKLPAVHAGAQFSDFKPANQEQARAQSVAKDFALRWPQVRGFCLSGPVGTGKTHLLASVLKHVTLELGVRAAYAEISLIYATIKRGFAAGKSGAEIIEPLANVPLLAIDELGKGRGSEFELETLDELIARRYNANRITLFATNYSLNPPEISGRAARMVSSDELKEAGRESRLLYDRVGARIYSRLCEMCEFVELPGDTPDRRRVRTTR